MKRYQAQEWQKNYQELQGQRGQLWSDTGILLGVRPIAVLQQLVKEGRAFIINSQAVNLYDKE